MSVELDLEQIRSHLESLTKYLVDVPSGSETTDAARNVAMAWTVLVSVLSTDKDISEFSKVKIQECIDKLRSATNSLEKLHRRVK